jgi:hypothetical protein
MGRAFIAPPVAPVRGALQGAAAKSLTGLDKRRRQGHSPAPRHHKNDGVSMPKFDMGAAWDDSMVLLKSHSALTGTIVAVFFFLPRLAVSWFGPVPIEPAADATFTEAVAAMSAGLRQIIPYELLIKTIGAIGAVGILRLWLSRVGISVGEALVFAIKMIPTIVAVQIILTLGMIVIGGLAVMPGMAAGSGAIGILLLMIGLFVFLGVAIYLSGRLALVSPAIADRSIYNPLTAIGDSWKLTQGNGWRVALFLILVMLVIGIAFGLLVLVVGAVAGTGEGAGRLITGVAEAIAEAATGIVGVAIAAAAYRQLAIHSGKDIFS